MITNIKADIELEKNKPQEEKVTISTCKSTIMNVPAKLINKENLNTDYSCLSTRVVTKESGMDEPDHKILDDFFTSD